MPATATPRRARVRLRSRWMIRRDLPAVVGVDAAEFPRPWSADDFCDRLRHRNCIGRVVEAAPAPTAGPTADGAVVGFVVYSLLRDHLRVDRLAGAGAALLLAELERKLHLPGERPPDRGRTFAALPTGEPGLRLRWPAAVEPAWRTSAVRALCSARPAPPLPILADALEEAGCTLAPLLALFRAGGALADGVFAHLAPELAAPPAP